MSSNLIENLRSDIKATTAVVELHEYARGLFYGGLSGGQGVNDPKSPWEPVLDRDPGKIKWQIFDHCASFTRLYAVYSIFVVDLVSEYLRTLPRLYGKYDQLPEAVLSQHRTGFGQILLKLGVSGPYSHLREIDIISQLSHGLSGGSEYVLLTDAFFVDRQNYRSDVLAKLIGSLGVKDVSSQIARHPAMKAFLSERIGDTATFESELNGFVRLRNEAAHGQVGQVIGFSQFRTTADFVIVLCEILVEMLAHELALRKGVLGQTEEVGTVKEVHYSGKVAVVSMRPITIKVGEELMLVRGKSVRFAKVCSLQQEGKDSSLVAAQDGQELGVTLQLKSKVGDVLRRVESPGAQQQPLFEPADIQSSSPTSLEVEESGQSEEIQDLDSNDGEDPLAGA
jgi:hypothetical protein